MSRFLRYLILPLCAAALASTIALAADRERQTPLQVISPAAAPHGSYLYRTYCASCHGESARGDGPLSAALRRSPPNLTEIAKRNHGVYPKELVFKVIDGRQRVPGHGGPDMPVWGDAFTRSLDIRDEKAVAARIQALTDFLETVQVRNAQ